MREENDIIQFDFDDTVNGYGQWDDGDFDSCNSDNLIGVDYWDFSNKLRYLI